ncbi:hypothetical protein niasHT_034552 [Heterodera trifolii]|uniref:Uncharacterized protein n=1 Tax=Heterodera trifolii TaxID=157864 RepID=A0ABD2IIM2_9BILA
MNHNSVSFGWFYKCSSRLTVAELRELYESVKSRQSVLIEGQKTIQPLEKSVDQATMRIWEDMECDSQSKRFYLDVKQNDRRTLSSKLAELRVRTHSVDFPPAHSVALPFEGIGQLGMMQLDSILEELWRKGSFEEEAEHFPILRCYRTDGKSFFFDSLANNSSHGDFLRNRRGLNGCRTKECESPRYPTKQCTQEKESQVH